MSVRHSIVARCKQVFARFADAGEIWGRALRCVATLDALASLAHISSQQGYNRPNVLVAGEGAALQMASGVHPCLCLASGNEKIPNNLNLGAGSPRMLLLTGPNVSVHCTGILAQRLIGIRFDF